MSFSVIKVQNLSKKYTLGQTHTNLLSERIGNSLRSVYRRIVGRNSSTVPQFHSSTDQKEFWALKDVSFEVKQGEVLGIIGRNGAGKSTLLKILSRITKPTEGRIELYGRVASLLEVGTGFHPELTGRENIFLNGAILGMNRAEIKRKFDEIVAFAEVEKFIDTPVKRYSSGMYVRLAFAVAAHLEPEILIIDEVLAVGDAQFQKKCIGKMGDVAKEGRTVLFVSHNMGMISDLCDICCLLDQGKIINWGETTDIISFYYKQNTTVSKRLFEGDLAEEILVKRVIINENPEGNFGQVRPSEIIVIRVQGESLRDFRDVRIGITISAYGLRIATLWDADEFSELPAGGFEVIFRMPAYTLRPGEYSIGVGADRQSTKHWLYGNNVCQLRIIEEWDVNCSRDQKGILNFRKSQVEKIRLIGQEVRTHH